MSPHLDTKTISEICESIDLDDNKKIYWNEFLAATISQAIYLKDENLREAFSNFDKEKKGYFELEDLQKALVDPRLNMNSQDFELVFAEAFPERKKQIYFEDFKAMMERLAT